jgi:predicted nucleic-acid-binding protein
MVYLIDTNIIIRFLVGDHQEHLKISTDIFKQIENNQIKASILESVAMEAFFVLTKFYTIPKSNVISDLKKLISLPGIVGDKLTLLETLNILSNKNIDFVDALLCAKSNLQEYKILSFDNDINKCI